MRWMALLMGACLVAATGAFAEDLTPGSSEAVEKPVHRRPRPAAPKPPTSAKPAPTPAPFAYPKPAPSPPHLAVAVVAVAPTSTPLTVTAPLVFTDWRALDAENTLVIDSDRGRILIELRPEFAPLAVARIKRLARSGLYDGLLFHRVIDGFVAQTGDPGNTDGGKSKEPDLPAEFTFRLGAEIPRAIAARPLGESQGFIGAQPYVSVDEQRMAMSPDRRVTAWGAYCAGVVGMGRQSDPNSGNSEFFILRDATRSLDKAYSPVGRVVAGQDIVRALPTGDPPAAPARMLRVRVLSDVPPAERPTVYVLNTLSPQFSGLVAQRREARGADFSICDVEAPVKVVSLGAAATPRSAPLHGSHRRRVKHD